MARTDRAAPRNRRLIDPCSRLIRYLEAKDDILLLANRFLPAEKHLSADALTALQSHRWPGNVRELQQLIASAAALSDQSRITARDLKLSQGRCDQPTSLWQSYLERPLSEGRQRLVEDFERAAIANALTTASGNISGAARQLGMHRQSLQQKMKTLGIAASH